MLLLLVQKMRRTYWMKWIKHSRLEGTHAFLGASQHSWLNYDEDKLAETYYNYLAAARGTKLHAIAAELIENRIKLPPTTATLNRYVNDAIGFRMKPEQTLYYSDNCYGTADAIAYSEEDRFLRIHDLKTGSNKVTDKYGNIPQLEIYAALFFLEYDLDLNETDIELRVYQNDSVIIETPGVEQIAPVIDKIIAFDKLIEQIKREEQ